MRLDVFLTPSELTPAVLDGRVVAVIDVLRATTTIAAALFAGAQTVIPFIDTDDAVRTARQYARGEVRLAGERNMVMIPGFDLGNSSAACQSALDTIFGDSPGQVTAFSLRYDTIDLY